MDLFRGRTLVIATMHGKEQVIASALKEALGVDILVPSGFNTDQFGTFSGEIERKVDPMEAAQLKCIEACKKFGCSLAVASEGSFGPHPTLFFMPGDDEILLFVDLENRIEVRARELSTETNFAGTLCLNWNDVRQFAEHALFPSHGLILRKAKDDTQHLIKGIRTWDELYTHCESCFRQYGQCFLETDMRAMHNPTRMKVIAAATKKLIEKIKSVCPECGLPGFDIIDIRQGLPCEWCGAPTQSTLSYLLKCKRCRHEVERMYPHHKEKEDPMFCNYCNP